MVGGGGREIGLVDDQQKWTAPDNAQVATSLTSDRQEIIAKFAFIAKTINIDVSIYTRGETKRTQRIFSLNDYITFALLWEAL